jgi:hypothetical protein
MKKPPPGWDDLRDDAGHLYGRIDSKRLLLEVSHNKRTATFDLRAYIRKSLLTDPDATPAKVKDDGE